MVQDCVFCKIVRGEISSEKEYENGEILVFHDIHPKAPIHLLIIPKKHVDEFVSAEMELWGKMSQVAKDLIEKMGLGPNGYRLVNNGGPAALIHHLHLHLLGDVAHDRDI